MAADGRVFKALGVGNIKVKLPNSQQTTTVTLKDAFYAPSIHYTLISLSRITKAGLEVSFTGPWCTIIAKNKWVITQIPETKGLYHLSNSTRSSETAHMALVTMGIDELHRKMGHISPTSIQRVVRTGRVTGVKLDDTKPTFCTSCVKAKLSRMPLPKVRSDRRDAKELGD